MNKIILENFRCFNKLHEIELRPLTFLVGENSTGKTSLLSAIRLAGNLNLMSLDFNREPFILGAYEQIASYASGRKGRAKHFRIGYERYVSPNKLNLSIRVEACFVSQRGQPAIQEFTITDGSKRIETKATVDFEHAKVVHTTIVNGETKVIKEHNYHDHIWPYATIEYFERQFYKEYRVDDYEVASLGERVPTYAFAPVRTRPERTYDLKSEAPQPEGNHIPAILRQLEYQPNRKNRLNKEVEEFGKLSGLFKNISVRLLGKEADPFQLLVKICGPAKNLIDVGYGVSQVLPILVDTLTRREKIFLLQQPEIHLHPRAQATLGSFIGRLVKSYKKQFIVETHSDYILDRVCLDIRDKISGLSPDDVEILFFQRKPSLPWVRVHRLTIDDKGHIVKPPKGYREFFLNEQARFFNI
ncbi:MAG: AAA family ATPase [Methanosarcinaceae archaeon]|nr:AAA family ATPase [Methanosarcinaceae archaeon]